MSKPHTKLTDEYDGGPFAGWAAQPAQRTVAGDLGRPARTVLGRDAAPTVAGPTGPGVDALLPDEIAVTAAEEAPDGFDARRDAISRSYLYRLLARPAPSPFEAGRALWWPYRLDRDALRACAAALRGTHDFTAFTPTETYHERFERDVLAAEWRELGDTLEFRIEADTFMRHMNRVLVGTMLEVAGGRRTVESFERLLAGAPRAHAGATAPAHGLYLASVRYGP